MNFVTFITISLTVSFTSAQIDVSSCTDAPAKIDKCNTDNGFSTTQRSLDDFTLLAMKNTAGVCGTDKEKIKTAAVCVLNVTRGCGEGEFPKLYPTASSVQSAFDTLCNNKDNVDFSCVNEEQINQCLGAKVARPAKNPDFSTAKTYYCQLKKSVIECMSNDDTLKACSSKPKTREVFLQLNIKLLPEACGAMTTVVTFAQIDVSSCTNAPAKIDKCNTDNGLSTEQRSLSDFVAMAVSSITSVCGTNKDKIKTAAGCVVDVTRGCGEGEFPKLYPTASSVQSAFDTLCNNKDNFDYNCVNITQIGRCLSDDFQSTGLTTLSRNADFSTAKTYYCQYYKSLRVCASTDSTLKACKSKPKTQDILVEIYTKLSPETCGAMTTVVPSVLLVASLFISFANNLI